MSGPTQEYRELAEEPERIRAMTNRALLKHFIDTELMIENDSGMPTNKLRMGFVYRVSGLERQEIFRRMLVGTLHETNDGGQQ